MAEDPSLIVYPEEVAQELGVSALDARQRYRVVAAIKHAQADALGALNRETLTPVTRVLLRQSPRTADLLDYHTWAYEQYDDKVKVVSAVPSVPADGTYTVTLSVGLDGRAAEPVRWFVLAHATELVRHDPQAGLGRRQVKSVSAGGQSVTYSEGSVAAGAAGALPNIASIKRYRRVPAFRRQTVPAGLWPYRGAL